MDRAGLLLPLVAMELLLLSSCAPIQVSGGESDYVGPGERAMRVNPSAGGAATDGAASAPSTQPATAPATMPTSAATVTLTGTRVVTLTDAVLLAVENNKVFAVKRLNPSIQRTFELQEAAAFDPDLTAQIQASRTRSVGSPSGQPNTNNTVSAQVDATQKLVNGAIVGIQASSDFSNNEKTDVNFTASRLGASINQPLLRGYGEDVNLANLRQAILNTRVSQYELRFQAETLVAQAEEAYWDHVLTLRQIAIFEQSLALVQQQLDETRERIKVGKLAETELAFAQAEVALGKENLINARSNLARTRLNLLRLMSPPGVGLGDTSILFVEAPTALQANLDDAEPFILHARRYRPEVNQALLLVQRDQLEVVKTKNGLLPKMDLFVNLGATGYAQSFGRSVVNPPWSGYDATVGLSIDVSPLNRSAKAADQRASITVEQAKESVDNLLQLVEVDVRTAFIEANRSRQLMAATAATRAWQEEKLRAETEKYRVGKSVALLVAQAQRDLLQSQIDEVVSLVNYIKAVVELYRLDGSLLQRRGILAPGGQPVQATEKAR